MAAEFLHSTSLLAREREHRLPIQLTVVPLPSKRRAARSKQQRPTAVAATKVPFPVVRQPAVASRVHSRAVAAPNLQLSGVLRPVRAQHGASAVRGAIAPLAIVH